MTDRQDEQWLREKYDSINGPQRERYLFISLKLKRLRNVNRIFGRSGGDELLELVEGAISDWLEQGEYATHLSGGYFNLLIRHAEIEDKIDYSDYSHIPGGFSPTEEAVVVRITNLSRIIRDLEDERFHGNIFTGFGIYSLPQEPVTFEIAQYNADLCRVESTQSAYWSSHLEIYGSTYFDPSIQVLDLRKSVVPAIESGHIKLYLQPKVDLKTGRISGAEALVRWADPVRGMIPLKDFLPALEINGLIQKVDLYLFEQVCGKIDRWRTEFGREIKISVNLSKYYFNTQNFLDQYCAVFEAFDIPKDCIEIELLESIVLDTNRLQEVVCQIRNYGFSCALDDFGSGFSSYSVLANADISVLKLDRSLFQDDTNRREKTVIGHIIQLAHELGICTVAEGVETQSYVDFLRGIGCDAIQGFFFYRPMPVEEFELRFIRNQETAQL